MFLDDAKRCEFVQNTEGCHVNLHVFNYLKFIFCTMGGQGQVSFIIGCILVALISFNLFVTLGMTADKL